MQGGQSCGKRCVQRVGGLDDGRRSVLRAGECEEIGRDPVEVTLVDSFESLILLKAEFLQTDQSLLLCLPNTVNDVLDGKRVVGLAVAGVAERHAWRVHLRNRRERKVRRPRLNKNHIDSKNACCVGATCEYVRHVVPELDRASVAYSSSPRGSRRRQACCRYPAAQAHRAA